MNRVLNVILAHQPRATIEKLLAWWARCSPQEDVLVVYGGTAERFRTLSGIQSLFISDPRLRVKETQRDKQSYGGIWREISRWLAEPSHEAFTHVYFAEFDHLPLVSDLAERLLARLEEERADVLAHHLRRIDGTSNCFYLYHLSDPAFSPFWQKISVRVDKAVVLQMHCSASFWTRKAFLAVAAQDEAIPVYTEVYLPTLAHHLGFRLRDFREQNEFVRHAPEQDLTIENAVKHQSWCVHPIKVLP